MAIGQATMPVPFSMRLLTILLATFTALSQAAQTRTWTETDYSDFEKGVIKNLSVRSDGRLMLAPRLQERFDSSSAYLWALAQDSAGNLYTGGGPGAKVYRITPHGDKKTLAEFDALEVHAIAVDRNDGVFVATSPDGKVYKIGATGKPEVFYDPKAKYIWALAFNRAGDLFVATGDQGEIHRVTPDGKGSVFFKSEETHARSMIVDSAGNLIVGTEPNGLVLRITPAGQGFVLYEMGKREITAVAAQDGSIYAAGVGAKSTATAPFTPPAPPPPTAPPPGVAAVTITPQRSAPQPPPSLVPGGATSVSGGSDVYRIHPDGYPEKIWSNSQDIVYAIGFDRANHVLLGSGNKGYVYLIDSDSVYTALLNAPPTQITALQTGRDGKLYAATGNVGKVYEIGPGLEPQGSIESDVLDAGHFAYWGRLSFKGAAHGGRIALTARTGNLDRPQKNWSPWQAPITNAEGARITSPAARFLQWKATLSLDGSGDASRDGSGHTPTPSPELDEVEIAYLPRNVAPRIDQVEVTPPNYRFPAASAVLPPTPAALNLPPIGKHTRSAPPLPALESAAPAMQYAKGFVGARWSASDENGDTLIFTVEIRGAKESEWKLLKDKVREKYLSWDSTAFPDGEYRVRVTASDLPSNTKEDALTTKLESDLFLIDNTPPRISGLTAARAGQTLHVRWKAADALSVIEKAEYSIDGGEWTIVNPVTKLSDSLEEDYDLALPGLPGGEHTIAVRVDDSFANQAVDKVVVR